MIAAIAAHATRDWYDVATIACAIGGFLILAGYTAATFWQARLTKQTLDETRRSNQTTEKNVQLAEKGLEIGSRAWLAVEFAQRREELAGVMNIALTISNVGRVPASNVTVYCRVDQWTSEDLPYEIAVDRSHEVEADVIIGPGVTHTVIPPAKLFASARRWQDSPPVTFFCQVTYSDLFNPARKTTRCWRYRCITTFDTREWIPAPKHNYLG